MGFDRRREERADVTAFVPILLANLVPLGGFVLLGRHIRELLVIYWLEIFVTLVLYSGAALFAERRVVLEGRTLCLPRGDRNGELDESKWGVTPEGTRLTGRYRRYTAETRGWSVARCFGESASWRSRS